MSGPGFIELRSGASVPVGRLGIAERLVLFDTAIDCNDKPAVKSLFALAAVGLVWEAGAKLEEKVPLEARSVPAPTWKPWAKCDRDIYAYGAGVLAALDDAGEDIMGLRSVGDSIIQTAWYSLQPPPKAIEAAVKNSKPEGATSSGSAALDGSTSETPSPPSN